MRYFPTVAMLLGVALNVTLSGCSNEDVASRSEAPVLAAAPVTVDRVHTDIAANLAEVVGTVEAVDQAEISTKISGNIVLLPVDLGSRVTQGDLLVELVAGEITAQLQQAEAQLAQARRNLAREESLLEKNAATQESVKSLRDAEKIAEAGYRQARTMVDYTRITAPFSGIITRKFVNVGDLATPAKVLLKIESESRHQIITDLPEALMLRVSKGDRLAVQIPSAGLNLEGEVSELSPTADATSRTVPVKIRLPANPLLRSGQFARVTIAMEQAVTFTVPASAILPYGQMKTVFVVDQGRAKLRLVRPGAPHGDRVEILSGLDDQEQVVISGNATLIDGQPVEIR